MYDCDNFGNSILIAGVKETEKCHLNKARAGHERAVKKDALLSCKNVMASLSANRCGGQRQHINLELLLLQPLFCLNLMILERAVGLMVKVKNKKQKQKPADRPKESGTREKTCAGERK